MTAMGLLFPGTETASGVWQSAHPAVVPGYGSGIIIHPVERIRGPVLAMADRIISSMSPIMRHNLYSTYTYLCAEFAFGLRPRNRPGLLVAEETGVTIVRDKQSAKFFEERILPFPSPLLLLMRQMRGGFDALKSRIAETLYPPAMVYEWTSHFFLLDQESGHKKDFLLSDMRKRLSEFGLPSYMPPNFPRHFLRSYLYEAGVSNDSIDAWLCHQHLGRELLNVASSALPRLALKECVHIIEGMLAELGFSELEYLPRVGSK